MALVRNDATYAVDLSTGRLVVPGEIVNADVDQPHEQSLIRRGVLTVTDGTVDPPAPTSKTVPVVTTVAYSDPSEQVTLDISGEATDAELAAAIAAIGGRFRGAYASLSTGAVIKANDVVTNPSGALVSRIADGTISGSYNSANWTALSAGGSGLPAGGTTGQVLKKNSGTDGDAGWGAAAAAGLTPTGVKTANYTAVAGDLVRVDTTSGPVTVTLPAAAAGAAPIGVKHVTQGGTNAVTVAAAGSDVFNKTGGSTTLPLGMLNQGVVLAPAAGVWVVQADDLALSQLDARFRPTILPWTGPGTAYKAGQPVTNGGHVYLATNDHTSGSAFASDLGAHWALLPVPGNAALLLGTDDTGVLNQLWKPEPPVTGNLVTGLSLPATVTNPTTTGTRLFRLDLAATSAEVPLAVRVLFKVSIPATASGFATAALTVGQRKADGTTHAQNIPTLDTTSPTTIDAVIASPGDSSKAMMNYVGMCEMEIGVFARYIDISVLGISGVFQGDVVLTELDVRYISAKGLPLRGGGESINADTISSLPASTKWPVDRAATRPDSTIARVRTLFSTDSQQEIAMTAGSVFPDSRYATREPGGTVSNLDPLMTGLVGAPIHVNNNDLIWSALKGDGTYELRGNVHGGELGRTGDFHLDYIFEQDRLGDSDWRRLPGNSQQVAAYRMRFTLKTKVQRSDAGSPFANVDRVYTFFADGVTRVDRTVTMLADQVVNKLYYIMNSFDPAAMPLVGRTGEAQSVLREGNGTRPVTTPFTIDTAGAASGQTSVPITAIAQGAFPLTGALIKIGSGGTAETARVASVTGSTLTLAANLTNSHASGETLIVLDDPTALASASVLGATTISTVASIPVQSYVIIDSGRRREVRRVMVAPTGTGPFTLTLDIPLDFNHPAGTPVQQITASDFQVESGRAHWAVYREPQYGACFGQIFDREAVAAHGLGGNITINLVRNTRSSFIAKMYSAIVPPAPVTLHSGLVLNDTYWFHNYLPQDEEAWHREIANVAGLTPADRNSVWSAT